MLRAEGWEDFLQRLSAIIADLEPRRRQAMMMLLFALVDQQLTPEDATGWIRGHDVDSDDGVEAMIAWLRQFRPKGVAP